MGELTLKNILVRDENVMIFQPRLAQLLGINETIILNQIHYWLEKGKNIIDGRPWVYNSYGSWKEQLCFLSISTIRKAIKRLEDMGLIISANFNRSKADKTKWYSIDYKKLEKIYEKMGTIEPEEASAANDEFDQSNVIYNESTDIDNQSICSKETADNANLNIPIPYTTPETTTNYDDKDNGQAREDYMIAFKKVVDFYSSNIRLPGSYELEKIKYLCEEFKEPELIILAMQQAVESNARNLRYAEKVLYNWLDKGIKTCLEAEKFIKDYKKYKGDRIDGKPSGIHRENKCYNPKASSENSNKWAGYKPPAPKCTGKLDAEGLI